MNNHAFSALILWLISAAYPAGGGSKDYAVNLNGARVKLGEPIQVTESVGRAWFPTVAKFASGELLALYCLTEDSNTAEMQESGFQVSRDDGKTWGHRYDVIPEFGSNILYPNEDGSILMIPHILYQRSPGDKHNFHAMYTRFERGGSRVVMEPGGLQVVDWPWPVEAIPNATPRSNWLLDLRFDGNAVRIGNRLVAPMHGTKPGEKLNTLWTAASDDDGRTWRYLATIADWSILGDSKNKPRAEGPNEPGMVQLANGDLMVVFRTGNGAGWHLGRAYSTDGGRKWSKVDLLPAIGVEPSVVRARNGIIAMTTGRPGLYLWVSTDDRARNWQQINMLEHHNRWAPNPTYRINLRSVNGRHDRDQTTAYTEIIEVAPNHLLVIYDRTPFGWEATPKDSGERNRIFVLPIEVTRVSN